MTDAKLHWERIYSENEPNEVSWHQGRPDVSLSLIKSAGIGKDASIIDVGGGASTLVDHLLDEGFQNLAILDISGAALGRAKTRLGDRASSVDWIESDIGAFKPRRTFALWHDRAVFHFLTAEQDRKAYVRTLMKALQPGGHLVIATFTTGGPKECSGLPIVQYSPDTLSAALGEAFELKEIKAENHRTPWGSEQKFVYCRFLRRG